MSLAGAGSVLSAGDQPTFWSFLFCSSVLLYSDKVFVNLFVSFVVILFFFWQRCFFSLLIMKVDISCILNICFKPQNSNCVSFYWRDPFFYISHSNLNIFFFILHQLKKEKFIKLYKHAMLKIRFYTKKHINSHIRYIFRYNWLSPLVTTYLIWVSMINHLWIKCAADIKIPFFLNQLYNNGLIPLCCRTFRSPW